MSHSAICTVSMGQPSVSITNDIGELPSSISNMDSTKNTPSTYRDMANIVMLFFRVL